MGFLLSVPPDTYPLIRRGQHLVCDSRSRMFVSFRQLEDWTGASVSEVGRQTWRWSSRPTRCTIRPIPVEPCAFYHSCPALPQQPKGRPRPRNSRCCISSNSDISSYFQYPPEAPYPQTP